MLIDLGIDDCLSFFVFEYSGLGSLKAIFVLFDHVLFNEHRKLSYFKCLIENPMYNINWFVFWKWPEKEHSGKE